MHCLPTPDEREQAIPYYDGYLLVDYDFLDEVNGVTAALYAATAACCTVQIPSARCRP